MTHKRKTSIIYFASHRSQQWNDAAFSSSTHAIKVQDNFIHLWKNTRRTLMIFTSLTPEYICLNKNIYYCTMVEVKAGFLSCQWLFWLLDTPSKESTHSEPGILFHRRWEYIPISPTQQFWGVITLPILIFSYPIQQSGSKGHCVLLIGYNYMCYAITSPLADKSNEVNWSYHFHRLQTKQRWEKQVKKSSLINHWLNSVIGGWKRVSRCIIS